MPQQKRVSSLQHRPIDLTKRAMPPPPPLSDYQHKISEMSVKLDAARLLTWKAAVARDAGESYTKEAAMAKLFASEAATFCSHAVSPNDRS